MEGKNRRGAQHTPTPWIADDGDGGFFAIASKDTGETVALLHETRKRAGSIALMDDVPLPEDPEFKPYDLGREPVYSRWAEHRANAAFIVKAANNHPDLVEALQKVRQELWVDYCLRMGRTDVPAFEFNSRPHIRIIDAALSRVED